MSKAILIMDMPSCCDECDIKGIWCGDVGDNDMCRAGGCALTEVPRRMDIKKAETMTSLAWCEGWNACIDKILGGAECD